MTTIRHGRCRPARRRPAGPRPRNQGRRSAGPAGSSGTPISTTGTGSAAADRDAIVTAPRMSIDTIASHRERPASRRRPGGALVRGHEQDLVLVLAGRLAIVSMNGSGATASAPRPKRNDQPDDAGTLARQGPGAGVAADRCSPRSRPAPAGACARRSAACRSSRRRRCSARRPRAARRPCWWM